MPDDNDACEILQAPFEVFRAAEHKLAAIGPISGRYAAAPAPRLRALGRDANRQPVGAFPQGKAANCLILRHGA